jgi:hypothetical protein
MDRTIGTCGKCGGAVTVPAIWMGIHPPTPQCVVCKAVPKECHGPVIPMRDNKKDATKQWSNF